MAFNVGIVGCGDIALKNYLPGTKALAGEVDIVATCDTRYERAVRAGEEFGAEECRAYGTLDELLRDPQVQGVQILTPWPLHYALALQALQAGKHVYVQKPMCQTLEEANRLVEEAGRRGLVLAAAPPNMISPTMQRIRSLVQEGVLGKVALVYCHSSHGGATGPGRFTDSQWFFMREAGEWTSLVDMGVYGLHSVTGILGPAKRVTAMSATAFPDRSFFSPDHPEPRAVQITSHDNGIVMLDWGEGTIGTVDGTFTMITREGPGLVLYGSRGVLSSAGRGGTFRLYQREDGGPYPKGWSEVDPEGKVVATGPEAGRSAGAGAGQGPRNPRDLGRDVAHWAACVVQGKHPILSAEHARHVVEIMEKAVVASQTGQAQDLTTVF
jgi:predicted dehydrogenase